jgi:DNA primase
MAYYSEDLIEEVISQNDIVEVISEYVTLKKNGRNFIGLCPFHREKTPSFCVSMDKQIFKCFGCSQGGNVISFIMKIENLDFWESVEMLAERAHIDLARYEQNSKFPTDKKDTKEIREVMFNINREVGIYYHNNLVELLKQDNNLVKEYVKRRQFDIKTITKFGIGFANGKIPLFNYLQEKGFTKEEILKSGILIQNDNGKIYDRFYSRLIFPIFDIRDRIVAFGGRVLDKSLPKYVNSQENEIYHKGKTLYLMNFAKRNKQDKIIIVEGYMDAIALQKSGFDNVVASLGTALTDDQARLLKKYTDNVIICYDQDSAGQNATLRGLDILNKRGINVKVLKLDKSDVKDPDEYINKYGKERFKNCIDNSISLVEFKVSTLEKELNINNIDSKIVFLTKTAEILAAIENDIEREIYINKIAEKYNIGTGPILKEIEKKLYKKQETVALDMQALTRKIHLTTSLRKKQEQYIIVLILSHDKNIQNKIFEKIEPKDIEDENVRKIYEFIIDLKNEYDINKIDILSKLKDEELIKELTEIIYIDTQNADNEKLLNDVLISKHKEKLYLRRDEILKRLDQNISKDEQDILQFELNQIIIEISKLKM